MNFLRNFIAALFTVFTTVTLSQPVAPVLRIENGMHTAKAVRMAADSSGKYILTCSNDKTARLWDASDGRLLRVLRIPIGEASEGNLYACALSADGSLAAVAGWTGYEWDKSNCVYVLNTNTGEIIKRLTGLPSVIYDLEFSPDGRYLAASQDEKGGVYIYNATTLELYKKIGGYDRSIFSIAFDKKHRLATACFDGKIRLYGSDFSLLETQGKLAGKYPISICFSSDDNRLAVGFDDVTTIEVRDAGNLKLLYKPSVKGVDTDGSLVSLGFSADGRYLVGGGTAFIKTDNSNKYFIRRWEEDGKGSHSDTPLLLNSITDIKSLPGGNMIVLGSYPDMAMIDKTDKIIWQQRAGNINYIAADKDGFRISEGAGNIGITPVGGLPFTFELLSRSVKNQSASYPSPAKEAEAILRGTVSTKKYERLLSIDFTSNHSSVVTGGDFYLYKLLNKPGSKSMTWYASLPGGAWAVNISGNNKAVAAALGDGTIRWYSMAEGKELLAFYLHDDKKRWVLFTPSGYYDASPGAEDFLGWHLNNGPDKTPSFYPVSRFKEKYYRPDIIDAILETYNEENAVTLANSRSTKKVTATETVIRQKLPPTITISSPVNGSNISSNTVSINYSISSPQDAPAKNIRVLNRWQTSSNRKGIKANSTTENNYHSAITGLHSNTSCRK